MTEAILTPQSLSLIPRNGLYLPFHGGTKTHLGVSPTTESGGIIYPAHLDRTAIQLAEATENLCDNPSFETNTTGWTPQGTNTLEISTEQAKSGSYSMKCTFVDHGAYAAHGLTLTAADHTSGLWVYVPSSWDGTGLAVRMLYWVGATGVIDGTVNLSLRDQWQFVHAHATPVVGDLFGWLQVVETGAAATVGKFIYVDGVQIEAKAYPTPYCDGSLGEGHSWSGTEHASTSSRTITSLKYTVNLADQFTVACWLNPLMLPSETDTWTKIWDWANDADDRMYLQYNTTSNVVQADGTFDGTGFTGINHTDLTRNTWVHLTLTFDGITVTLYADGTEADSRNPAVTSWGTAPSQLSIGSIYNATTYPLNGWLDEFIALDYALTASEVGVLWG